MIPSNAQRARGKDKQIRISGNRAKTGCVTCKVRRVKCDEVKPNCKRCTNTGRKCDGYEQTSQPLDYNDAQHIGRPDRQLSPFPRKDHSAWEYYYHRGRHDIAGCFGSTFWAGLIMQMSQSQSAVHDAIVSISIMHEAIARRASDRQRGSLGGRPDVFYTTALSKYNKAVRTLNLDISSRKTGVAFLTLVCCILFVTFEMLNSEHDMAARHIESGLELIAIELEQARQQQSSGTDLQTPVKSLELSMTSTLAPIYNRLLVSLYFSGRPTKLLGSAPTPALCALPVAPKSFSEARQGLMKLTTGILKFIHNASDQRYFGSADGSLLEAQAEWMQSLRVWTDTLVAMTETLGLLNREQNMSMLLLFGQSLTVMILLSTCLVAGETAFDAHFSQFQRILDVCGAYMELQASTTGTSEQVPTFTLDMGIIPQLYFVATKCRHPVQRQSAIGLLAGYSCKEGMWDPTLYLGLARRVAEIEEASSAHPGRDLPPEHGRLWSATVKPSRRASRPVFRFSYKPVEMGGRGLTWEESTKS
ncbi:uncharacterized protein F5Z01DRAFT_652097 [Emericellopsis atlantica]|uniref:Zn(2)-C6 fungal-type domain-containing protein n=1 Tax=Emericellopsis atlantica TaxID=2614577 RepID=A0A9P8CQZ2_9HYPO|nr:uncharacterized protein F5Z01DRAFT_652097 [Emericellopsis atlantica]KAG9255777.1 hypothetical protein F5Z01DRAFT_652097 [Emericellopsis atlantica]